MSLQMHGNLALNDRHVEKQQQTKTERNVTRKVYRAKSLPTPEKVVYLATVFAFCLVAGLIAFRYTAIFEVNTRIVQTETQIHQLQDGTALLKNEIASLQDPERLIETGIQLGLSLPQLTPITTKTIVAGDQGQVAIR
jgi:cell division protein FtsL